MRSRCTRAAQKENTRPCGWAVFPLLVSETIDASSMHAACSVGAPCDVATVAALKSPDSPALLVRFRCPSVAFRGPPRSSRGRKKPHVRPCLHVHFTLVLRLFVHHLVRRFTRLFAQGARFFCTLACKRHSRSCSLPPQGVAPPERSNPNMLGFSSGGFPR